MANSVKAGLTTSALLKSIKRRAMVPDNQNTFSDQDFIDLMNEEMMIGIIPSILQMKEEYLLFRQETPIIANKSRYPIPERSLANKLRELCYKDTTTAIGNEYEMTQVAVDDRYSGLSNGVGSSDFSGFRKFYVLGNDVVLHPGVGSAAYGSLVYYYYLRPNTIVKESEVAYITNIDRTLGTITLSSVPSTYLVSEKYDFVKAKSPHNILSIDIVIDSINASSKIVTLDADLIPLDLEVGDYFPLAGQTCLPNIPTELHMVLAQRVSQRLMEALGDTEGLSNATAKIIEMEGKLGTMLTSRVEGAPRKVVNRGLMTGSNRNRRR